MIMRNRAAIFTLIILCACEKQPSRDVPAARPGLPEIAPQDMALMLSELPIGNEQLKEVHAAVSSSSSNGYDEEYMMRDIFLNPGAGVGSSSTKAQSFIPNNPMRSLIEDYLRTRVLTKGGDEMDVTSYIEDLTASGLQIYWPFSENWDGTTMPLMTFDPGTDSQTNEGYRVVVDKEGNRHVERVTITEQMARQQPVWVVNSNDDSTYKTVEMLRRDDPEWGQGGSVIVKSQDSEVKSLIMKDFVMKRHYDSWFRGASEFFVKCGCVENFTASTEAEMRLYTPSVTDFMVVVKRNQLGVRIPFNALLISDWTPQLESIAFLVTEDDGGTRTSWKAETTVKVNSKSYGITVDLPMNVRDEIVWRGSITSGFMERYSGIASHFGDVDITFEIL